MNIGVLKGALVYALPHQQKNMQYSAQTHTRDNAPRAKTENVNERKAQDKKYFHPLTLSFIKSTTTFIFIRALMTSIEINYKGFRSTGKNAPSFSLGLFSSLHHLLLMLFYELSALLDQKADNKHSVYHRLAARTNNNPTKIFFGFNFQGD